jgi:hypothetical protein
MIRKLASRILYAIGEACFLMAATFSPDLDEVWRDRRWKQFLRNESRLDSYEVPDTQAGGEIESPWDTKADDGD